MSLALCLIAFLLTVFAGRMSRVAGLATVIGIGYVYGIVRANLPETLSHFIFDSAVLGFYVTQFSRRLDWKQQLRVRQLKPWLVFLIGWPVILFFIPVQD